MRVRRAPAPVVLTGITGFIATRVAADPLNAGYACAARCARPPAPARCVHALHAVQGAAVTRVVLASSAVALLHKEPPEDRTGHPTGTRHATLQMLAERAAWHVTAGHREMRMPAIGP